MDIARALVQLILAQWLNTICRQVREKAVVIEILDSKGNVINTYNSETPVLRPGRGGAGGANMPGVGTAGPESQPDPDAAPTRACDATAARNQNRGHQSFRLGLRNQAGVMLPPGQYQVRLKTGM